MNQTRDLTLTGEALQAYSRRGNFHADADEAAQLGLPGLVAQGMQVASPAYGLLLDAWGEEFLARGEISYKFVGMVLEDETVRAEVEIDTDDATFEVTSTTTGRVAVVGSARAHHSGEPPPSP